VLAPLVAASPGLRSPGTVDGTELLVRAILGQQVTVAGARTIAGRLAALVDDRVHLGSDGLRDAEPAHPSLLFPSAAQLADLDPELLPMPAARRRALLGACRALADGELAVDPGVDRDDFRVRLQQLPGIGPWTAQYVAMRALGDPDVFMPTDLGVRHALERLGHDGSPGSATALSAQWSPWRSYALHHLWHSLSAPASPAAGAATADPRPVRAGAVGDIERTRS